MACGVRCVRRLWRRLSLSRRVDCMEGSLFGLLGRLVCEGKREGTTLGIPARVDDRRLHASTSLLQPGDLGLAAEMG